MYPLLISSGSSVIDKQKLEVLSKDTVVKESYRFVVAFVEYKKLPRRCTFHF